MKHSIRFFSSPRTLEELKKQYRELALKHHPDRGGSDETMKAVNNEYDLLFPELKDIHQTKDGETYTAKQASTETADQFKDIISELLTMEGLIIEIIGCFIWVTGDTKQYKDQLKDLHFQWHSKKIAWYLKPEDYKKRSRKDYDLDTIRNMYGSSGKQKNNGITKLDESTV